MKDGGIRVTWWRISIAIETHLCSLLLATVNRRGVSESTSHLERPPRYCCSILDPQQPSTTIISRPRFYDVYLLQICNYVSKSSNNLYIAPKKKFFFNLRNHFFNFIPSIRNKNTFRTNIKLFGYKKSRF